MQQSFRPLVCEMYAPHHLYTLLKQKDPASKRVSFANATMSAILPVTS